MEQLEKFLVWYASMNIISFKNKSYPDYKLKGTFSFYLAGSPERFSETEIISIFANDADGILMDRWYDAVADTIQHTRKQSMQ